MPTPKFLRLAWRIHAVYFYLWAVIFEFLPEPLIIGFFGLEMPKTAVGWAATGVSAGGLLTIGTLLLLASFQTQLPRFVIAVVLAQTTFNLYHDVVWFTRGHHFGLTLLDTVVIAGLFVTYLIAWQKTKLFKSKRFV